jgi:hypothetical protein
MHRLETRIFTALSILVSGLCMLYHNFYCIFPCYLPWTKRGLRYLYVYSCSYTDMAVKHTTVHVSRLPL